MSSKSKHGTGHRIKPAKTGNALLAQLDADPLVPVDYTTCWELSIEEEQEEELAQSLFKSVQDPAMWCSCNATMPTVSGILPHVLLRTKRKYFRRTQSCWSRSPSTLRLQHTEPDPRLYAAQDVVPKDE